MLVWFKLDDQTFHHVGDEVRQTSKGRSVKLAVWESVCPDCGRPFTQAHRAATFRPARNTYRRCAGCRKGPGKRVLRITTPSPKPIQEAANLSPEPMGVGDQTGQLGARRAALPSAPPPKRKLFTDR